jgi:hypothetical protein
MATASHSMRFVRIGHQLFEEVFRIVNRTKHQPIGAAARFGALSTPARFREFNLGRLQTSNNHPPRGCDSRYINQPALNTLSL